MKRMLSVVIALTVLPALAQVSLGTVFIKTGNLERLVTQISDWKSAQELPAGKYRFQSVQICQNPAWGAPNIMVSCHSFFYARNLDDGSGYVQPSVLMGGMAAFNANNEWYRASPKRNSWLYRRVKDHLVGDSPLPATGSGETSPTDSWRPPIPGNRSEDPRWEERKNQ